MGGGGRGSWGLRRAAVAASAEPSPEAGEGAGETADSWAEPRSQQAGSVVSPSFRRSDKVNDHLGRLSKEGRLSRSAQRPVFGDECVRTGICATERGRGFEPWWASSQTTWRS